MSKYLLKNLDQVARKVRGKGLSLFLDFDGTLTPIMGRPEVARLSFNMRELLRVLVLRYPTVVISGRGLVDIKGRVSLKGVVYAGNHGLEISSEAFTMVFDPGKAVKGEMKKLIPLLRGLPRAYRGVIIENKGVTISVHYRLLDSRDVRPFTRKLKEIAQPSIEKGYVRITEGKKVFEIRPPVEWNKGRAVEWIMQRRNFSSTVPVYMGDDVTDRDGFRAVKGTGLSVSVGGADKEADFFLKAQGEVNVFLGWLKERKWKRPV
jgi:trehalose-phosphatase